MHNREKKINFYKVYFQLRKTLLHKNCIPAYQVRRNQSRINHSTACHIIHENAQMLTGLHGDGSAEVHRF